MDGYRSRFYRERVSIDRTSQDAEIHRAPELDPLPTGIRILQVGALMPFLEHDLRDGFAVVRLPDGDAREAFLADHADEIEIAITSGGVGIPTALLAALPSLRSIIHFGVGYDTTDVAGAQARGIVVSNTPDVLNDCVADTALTLLLDVFRRASEADRFVRRGEWADGRFPLAVKFSGKRIGIVGLGRIGSAIAARLEGFGCVVSYHNRREVEGCRYTYVDSLLELARDSDALVVAAAGGPASSGLISHEVLEALGPQGFLVNIARGSVVDQSALIAALTQGTIAGAGLDVFADEPRVPLELLALDNVVLLPHLASGTHETRRAMADLVLDNLRSYLRDRTLVTPVV